MEWAKIIDQLDWNNNETIINDAKNKLLTIPEEYIHLLMQPSSKWHWENAADVVVHLNVNSCFPEMLKWLQDLNWPGAKKIFNMLSIYEGSDIDKHITDALILVKLENDEVWYENIDQLIKIRKIKFTV